MRGSQLPLRVVADLGPIGDGSTCPHKVRAEDTRLYVMKGADLTPQPELHRFVAANELIAARLAEALGLPVLDHRLLVKDGRLYFGSRYIDGPPPWLRGGFFHITREKLDRCANPKLVYELVVFDTWICNQDRNYKSLVTLPDASGDERMPLRLLLNDHSNCLVLAGLDVDSFSALREVPPCDRFVQDNIAFLRQAINSCERLDLAITRLEHLLDERVTAVVEDTPGELLSSEDRAVYGEFLLYRKSRIRSLFRTAMQVRFFECLDADDI